MLGIGQREAHGEHFGAAAARCWMFDGGETEGSVAFSLCTTAYQLHNGFANTCGASVSEATMRPDPVGETEGGLAKTPEVKNNLGQPQPVTTVFPQECTGQLASAGPT
jgi:hypothetical protein